jgi:hypothetical protein
VLRAGNAANTRHFRRLSLCAMLLTGLAIQIKYTVMAEGLCFGLLLSTWSLARLGRRQALAHIAVLALAALTPTLAVFGFYAAIGQAQAFWFANFASILLRAPTAPAELQQRTLMMVLRVIPFAACIAVALATLWKDRTDETNRWRLVMLCWCGAATFGVFAIGTLYSHYILPAFVPFTVATAPAFSRRPSGPILALVMILLPAQGMRWPNFAQAARHRAEIARLVALVPPDVDKGCLQMFDGPMVLDYLTRGCALSRFVFPDHLSARLEAGAIGVNPADELRRLLARRPEVITNAESDIREPNVATFAIMRKALVQNYRLAGRSRFNDRMIDVYVRRETSLVPPNLRIEKAPLTSSP